MVRRATVSQWWVRWAVWGGPATRGWDAVTWDSGGPPYHICITFAYAVYMSGVVTRK